MTIAERFTRIRDSRLVLIVGLLVAAPVWIAALAFYAAEWILLVWSFLRALFP